MKVLFIGGTGLISTAVSKLAVDQGIELYLFNRGQSSSSIPQGAKLIEGDIRDKAAAAKVLADHEFDAVVDWIVFTPEHAESDIELFRGRTKQYIFISSASAYQKPLEHYRITESTPLVNPFWPYSRDKIACEELLMAAYRQEGFPVTIVRPSYTYGDTKIPASLNSSSHSWSLVDRMRRDLPIIVHGDGSNLWTMTHNTDFAAGFIGLLGHPEAIGEAFHITSDEVLTWDQIYQQIGEAAGVKPKIVHIASDFITSLYPEHTGGLHGDKAVSAVFDNSKIKRYVPSFQAKISFAEGIKRTIRWFEQHPEAQGIDEAWNRKIDHILAAYNQ